MSNLLLDVFTLVMTFFVPGVVWTVLIAVSYTHLTLPTSDLV